ncbi:MAG: hypothetical protein LBQ41_04605 [Candidatus Ancillula sp.]|nr:hypothetical protein [Candidatus Ancillula sp.]
MRGIIQNYRVRAVEINCAVSFTKLGDDYLTITQPEAIANNKKILTDAQCIKKLKCYDPRWIKVVNSPEEITEEVVEWMMTKENVQYENTQELYLDGWSDKVRELFEHPENVPPFKSVTL